MIVCPVCSHRNSEGTELCESCGRSLAKFAYRVCPSCGALNAAQHVFCHRCFAELTLGEGEEPIPESALVRPYTPPIVTLEEEIAAKVERGKVEAPTGELSSLAASDLLSERLAPLELGVEPQVALPESAPREEQIAAPAQEEVGPEVPSSQVVSPEEAQTLSPEVTASPLEGLEDLLPFETAVTLPHRPPKRESAAGVTEDYEAELFQQVAVERASLQEDAQVVSPSTVPVLSRVGRLVLYILVLLAGLLPFFTWGQISSFVQPREAVLDLVRTIEELPSGAEVLLSFDYSPTYAGELDPLALAVVRHLARRSVRMVVMSTKPEGVGLAEAIYRTITEEFSDYRYGEHYVLLGYLPGQEAGLRSLNAALGDAFKVDYVQGRPLGELGATSGLATLKDFDQIIVLSDDGLTVRRWVEQVQSRSDFAFHALVTSAVEPMLVPYQRSGQLLSLIPAASGVVEYEVASAVKPSALFQSDAYVALFVLLLLVAIITNVLYMCKRKQST